MIAQLEMEPAYKQGFNHAKRGHYYEPPSNLTDRAYYLAGFNVAKNRDIYACASSSERDIIKRILNKGEKS